MGFELDRVFENRPVFENPQKNRSSPSARSARTAGETPKTAPAHRDNQPCRRERVVEAAHPCSETDLFGTYSNTTPLQSLSVLGIDADDGRETLLFAAGRVRERGVLLAD